VIPGKNPASQCSTILISLSSSNSAMHSDGFSPHFFCRNCTAGPFPALLGKKSIIFCAEKKSIIVFGGNCTAGSCCGKVIKVYATNSQKSPGLKSDKVLWHKFSKVSALVWVLHKVTRESTFLTNLKKKTDFCCLQNSYLTCPGSSRVYAPPRRKTDFSFFSTISYRTCPGSSRALFPSPPACLD